MSFAKIFYNHNARRYVLNIAVLHMYQPTNQNMYWHQHEMINFTSVNCPSIHHQFIIADLLLYLILGHMVQLQYEQKSRCCYMTKNENMIFLLALGKFSMSSPWAVLWRCHASSNTNRMLPPTPKYELSNICCATVLIICLKQNTAINDTIWICCLTDGYG